jgi:hypothetical protein
MLQQNNDATISVIREKLRNFQKNGLLLINNTFHQHFIEVTMLAYMLGYMKKKKKL